MRKIIIVSFVTLDGIIQSPGGKEEDTSGGFIHGGWIVPFSDPLLRSIIKKQMDMPFDLLLGRRTYEIWASYWPHHGDIWPNANLATKYVVSNSIKSPSWEPVEVLNGDIADKVTQIKKYDGPDLHVYGSSSLVQTLLRHDLIDSLWLKIFPITLGTGKRLFADGTIPASFRLAESTITSKDVIAVCYDRAGEITTGNL